VGQGTYEFGTNNAAATLIAKSHGVPIVSIAVLEQDALTVIFSLKDRNIIAPKDLIGKTLGVRYYDISHREYKAMMAAQGLDTSKVEEVGIGWEPQPLLTGQVDALYSYIYGLAVQLEVKGYQLNKIFVKDWGVNGLGSNLIANADLVEKKPDVVRRFLRASIKGWWYAIEHPLDTVDTLIKLHPELDWEANLAMLKAQVPLLESDVTKERGLGAQSKERWEATQTTLFAQGVIDQKVNLSRVYTNAFLH